MENQKPKRYQICSSKLFLTYPQCPVPKEDALQILTNIFLNVQHYIIAREEHKNGDLHLHCYLEGIVEQPWRATDPKFADFEYNGELYHGNYQGCKSAKNVQKYVTKGDDYLSDMDMSSILGKASNKRAAANLIIKKRQPLIDVIKIYPELVFDYKKHKQNIEAFLKDADNQRGDLPKWIPNPWGKILPTFRKGKKRHYWIYSRLPNVGKTTGLAKPLFDECRCCLQVGDYSYWNICGNEQAIILDEYNGAKFKYFELNSMCDGTYGFKVFMGGVVMLKDPLIIVLSNQSISDIYPYMNNLIYERMNEIEIV